MSEPSELPSQKISISWLDISDYESRQAMINAAWQDMRTRQRKGEQIRAEHYFDQDDSNVDESLAVDIIYGEYALRLEYGDSPILADYLERFPRFASAIKRQLAVHEGMESSEHAPTWDLTPKSDVLPADEETPTTAPTKVGQYVLLAKLSEGGQAAVYRAVHPTLSRELVVKVAHRPLGGGSSAANRLLEEGRILAELEHPNLAHVYDMGIDSGRPYLVLEYVRGRTLDQYVREELPDWREGARIVADVAAAVSAAHRHNVVHLDIKPRNIVVDEHGIARLLDFGLARLFDAFREKPRRGEISGTVQFMAPEQARGDGEAIGRRTDVFGLGGVLYFMLAGKAPFQGTSSRELLPRVAKGEWDRQSLNEASVPRRLQAICSRAMEPDINSRYASADELATALHRHTRSARLTRVLGAVVVATVAALGLFLLIRQYGSFPEQNSVTLAADVRQTDGHYAELASSLPLRNGDKLRLHTDVPAGMHAGLFAFTSSGTLHQLKAWEPVDEARRLTFPGASNEALPLDDNSGTEFIFVCTRAEAPLVLEDVRKVWRDSQPLESLPDYTIAVAESRTVRFDNFGKGFGPVVQHDDPESAVQRRLIPILEALDDQFSGVAGIAFAHKR